MNELLANELFRDFYYILVPVVGLMIFFGVYWAVLLIRMNRNHY